MGVDREKTGPKELEMFQEKFERSGPAVMVDYGTDGLDLEMMTLSSQIPFNDCCHEREAGFDVKTIEKPDALSRIPALVVLGE